MNKFFRVMAPAIAAVMILSAGWQPSFAQDPSPAVSAAPTAYADPSGLTPPDAQVAAPKDDMDLDPSQFWTDEQNAANAKDIQQYHAYHTPTDNVPFFTPGGISPKTIQGKNGKQQLAVPAPVRAANFSATGTMLIDVYVIQWKPAYLNTYANPAWLDYVSRTTELKSWIESGSQFQSDYGVYATAQSPSLGLNIKAYKSFPNAPPAFDPTHADIGAIMNLTTTWSDGGTYNLCNKVKTSPNPVWILNWGDSRSHFPEQAPYGPYYSTYGFPTSHNMAFCNNTYVFFGLSMAGEDPPDGSNVNWHIEPNHQALHSYGHYLEDLMRISGDIGYLNIGCNFMDATGTTTSGANIHMTYLQPSVPAYNSMLTMNQCAIVGAPYDNMGNRANFLGRSHSGNTSTGPTDVNVCGNIHFPLTQNPYVGEPSYIYNSVSGGGSTAFSCNRWWTQNSPQAPNPKIIRLFSSAPMGQACAFWNCNARQWYTYWNRRIPGRNSPAVDRLGNPFNIDAGHYGFYGLMWV